MMLEKLFTIFASPPASLHCEKTFLTLITWYHYLPSSDFPSGSCDVKGFYLGIPGDGSGRLSDLPLVLAAVIDDLLQIAGLVALAFVLVGAIKYTASQGSPDAAASAQSTIINALIGLAIAVTGVAFINFIGTHVGR
ncbi:MAG TPA: hypothetical protein VH234_05115 [Candidatus Saccharimonadales bacterium]|jgi:hypothetical protein|nr:hypothetical protein [Candidatus Saccharimonadales bacterium]